MIAAHPQLRPALLQQVLAVQRQPMNRCGLAVTGMLAPRLQQPMASTPAASPRRYSNTLKEQQRFKAAASELLQGAPAQGATQPAVDMQSEKLEKALLAATTTAKELAGRVQVSSLSHWPSCAEEPSACAGCEL